MLQPVIERARAVEPERAEGAVAARGMADAVAILARRYTLQATNVPFLSLSNAANALQEYVEETLPTGNINLYAVFLVRMRVLRDVAGTIALVTPQNWYSLVTYKPLRRLLLSNDALNLICDLGPAAFNDMNWWRREQHSPLFLKRAILRAAMRVPLSMQSMGKDLS
jgi:hypothetical protein